jgi:hypothetical protein
MFSVFTCNGYTSEKTTDTLSEAIAYCQMRERDSGDGFARVVSCEGRLVADAEGAYPARGLSAYERLESSGDAF